MHGGIEKSIFRKVKLISMIANRSCEEGYLRKHIA